MVQNCFGLEYDIDRFVVGSHSARVVTVQDTLERALSQIAAGGTGISDAAAHRSWRMRQCRWCILIPGEPASRFGICVGSTPVCLLRCPVLCGRGRRDEQFHARFPLAAGVIVTS